MGDFVNKKICLNICLSIILGSLLVISLVVIDLPTMGGAPKISNTLNSDVINLNSSKKSEENIDNQLNISQSLETSENESSTLTSKSTSFPVPTFTTNIDASKVLPSVVTKTNYAKYFVVGNPAQIVNGTMSFEANNVEGNLVIKMMIYKTYDETKTAPATYTFNNQFARTGVSKPMFNVGDKTLLERTLPSTINNNNYKDYLIVDDNDGSLITNDITFDGNDATGELTITGSYYTTSFQGNTAPRHTIKYRFQGFAFYSQKPLFKINDIQTEILPSAIDDSNYQQYLEVKDDNASLVPNSVKFNSNDGTGVLTVTGSYYTTNFHGPGALMSTYSYNIKGFDVGKSKTASINEDIIIIATVSSILGILLIGLIIWYFLNKSREQEIEIISERDPYERDPYENGSRVASQRMRLDYKKTSDFNEDLNDYESEENEDTLSVRKPKDTRRRY